MRSDSLIQYSIVVPFYDEQENIPALYMKLTEVMDGIGGPYELVFVDDGSKDNTFKVLSEIFEHDRRVNLVRLRRNFGQTPALKAGFDFAQGEIVISMDGDLQHDPEEIPRFLEKIEEGYDLVCGWRQQQRRGLLHGKYIEVGAASEYEGTREDRMKGRGGGVALGLAWVILVG